jgi:hypothetical protein
MITNIIGACGFILTFASIIVIIYELKKKNEYTKLDFFEEYTKRYSEIMLNLPNCVHEQYFDYEQHSEQTENILRYMRAYFDLCSEELYLYQQNRIDKYVWENWEEGIKMALQKEAFRIAWEKLYKNKPIESQFYKDFNEFIERIIKCSWE